VPTADCGERWAFVVQLMLTDPQKQARKTGQGRFFCPPEKQHKKKTGAGKCGGSQEYQTFFAIFLIFPSIRQKFGPNRRKRAGRHTAGLPPRTVQIEPGERLAEWPICEILHWVTLASFRLNFCTNFDQFEVGRTGVPAQTAANNSLDYLWLNWCAEHKW